jgi:poly(3-hydroxybutyrate) depolymerase
MSATKDGTRRVFLGMGRQRRVATAALLVAFAWIGGCAPLVPGRPGARLSAAIPPSGRLGGGVAPPELVGGTAALGAQAGLHAASASEVPMKLPDGRQYVIHVPKAADGQPRPLVIALHGMYLSWENLARAADLSSYADRHGFLVAYGVGVLRSWNIGGGCCSGAARKHADDVGYLVSIVRDVASRIPVDMSRVYLTGFSTGDSMALYAQCQRPDVFAASAGSSGALLFPCRSRQQVRVLHMHGRLDQTVPFNGGRSDILGRQVSPASEFGVRVKLLNPAAAVSVRLLPCGHTWPRRDNACGVDGTDLIWQWLSRFSR